MKVELPRQSNCQYIQGKQDSLAAKAFLRSSCQGSQAVKAVKLSSCHAVKLSCCHAVMLSSCQAVKLSYSQAVKQLPSCQAVKLLSCQGN